MFLIINNIIKCNLPDDNPSTVNRNQNGGAKCKPFSRPTPRNVCHISDVKKLQNVECSTYLSPPFLPLVSRGHMMLDIPSVT